MIYKIFYSIVATFLLASVLLSQSVKDKVYVDNGILKWTETNKEAAFFGVNYTTPFAHSYRAIKKLGLSHKEAIDIDVSQFARLEFDAFRIHVWDREVADTLGNLIKNVHMDLLDYLISKLKEKNINIILTPIAWWGTGWPEPDPSSTGFSNNYSKVELLTDKKACKAQRNYIKQFLNHKNIYTGFSYKNDPDIIAFEIINEPGHPADTSIVTEYINEMVDLVRSQNVSKPIYYNISQNWSDKQAAAVYNANIDGISFQWYPTGLVKYAPLNGNYLAHVDHYPVPQIDDPKFNNKTRMIYEFDAADVDQSIMYPAIARSFKEAGMQWATMFSYDPTFLAPYNTEYSTHYVNLVYAPQKAISLMIAANVFRTLKTYQQFKSYPENLEFEGFKISYENNLSELNNGEKFYYSNNTTSLPVDLKKLRHVSGYGSSSIVKTNAKGAYFLDKIDDYIWRLEIYPDVVELMNSYGKNSLDNMVRVAIANSSDMKLSLPGLSENFIVQSVKNKGDHFIAQGNKISVKPGIYILSNEKVIEVDNLKFGYYNRSISEFPSPIIDGIPQKVLHTPLKQLVEGHTWNPKFTVISQSKIDTAILYLKQLNWKKYRPIPLKKSGKYIFEADVKDGISNGDLEYCFYINTVHSEMSYPAAVAKNPNAWDYYTSMNWHLKIVPAKNSIVLFDPEKNQANLNFPNVWQSVEFDASSQWDDEEQSWLKLSLTKFKKPLADFTFQIELDEENTSVSDISDFKFVEFEIDKSQTNIARFKFQLINSQYESIEKNIILSKTDKVIKVPLNTFKSNEFVLLPRPYPHFLPYSYKNKTDTVNGSKPSLIFIQIGFPIDKSVMQGGQKTLQFSSIKLTK